MKATIMAIPIVSVIAIAIYLKYYSPTAQYKSGTVAAANLGLVGQKITTSSGEKLATVTVAGQTQVANAETLNPLGLTNAQAEVAKTEGDLLKAGLTNIAQSKPLTQVEQIYYNKLSQNLQARYSATGIRSV